MSPYRIIFCLYAMFYIIMLHLNSVVVLHCTETSTKSHQLQPLSVHLLQLLADHHFLNYILEGIQKVFILTYTHGYVSWTEQMFSVRPYDWFFFLKYGFYKLSSIENWTYATTGRLGSCPSMRSFTSFSNNKLQIKC